MKHEYPEIFKKAYHKPCIEEILLDREMSLVMQTNQPPVEPENPGDPPPPDLPPGGVAPYNPDYGNYKYKTEYPLGGDRIVY